ncbi:Mediator of RNA polymerase II transcription subunit 17 [Strongyloides ratti]|uniref:Mediator of RNA polymerase II transcription subunit 17 n=1 Tax=Strongyloides ratti TaxID=34506 RepID=A0A090LGY2_STRRB|nr:Mediator of RNA polymerase II transcription subunit 17 [Strongyloides ratti]CEF69056.1 Mediator of RNA polymerase II transcription subunit 17 [Strongyloides ratti]
MNDPKKVDEYDSKFVKPIGIPNKNKKYVYVEPRREWSVMEYSLEGAEALIPPKTFQESLAEKASRIDWKKIVGSNVTYDDPEVVFDTESDKALDLVDRILALKIHQKSYKPPQHYFNNTSKLVVKPDDLQINKSNTLNNENKERERFNKLLKEANEAGLKFPTDDLDYDELSKHVDINAMDSSEGPVVITDMEQVVENNITYESFKNQKYIEGETGIDKKKKKEKESDDEDIGYMMGKAAVESFRQGRIKQELEHHGMPSIKRVVSDPQISSKIRYFVQKRLQKKVLEYNFIGMPLQNEEPRTIFQILRPSSNNTFGILPQELSNEIFDPTKCDEFVKELTDRQVDAARKAWDALELQTNEFDVFSQLRNDTLEAKNRGEDVKTVSINFGSSRIVIPVIVKDSFSSEPRKSDEMSSDSEDEDFQMDVDKEIEEEEHIEPTSTVAFYINRSGKLLGCKIDGESYSLDKPEFLGNELTKKMLEAIENNGINKKGDEVASDDESTSSRGRNKHKDTDVPSRAPSPIIPEAGPWHKVAKYLHEALQHINYLHDQLRVMDTPYMKPLTVAESIGDENTAINSKLYLWVAKRKALEESVAVLETGTKHRKVDTESFEDKQAFFNELKSMREFWRLRKVGRFLTGDLGYRIFGSKFIPSESFDVTRKSSAMLEEERKYKAEICDTSPLSYLQVIVPCDLMRRTVMSVDIIIDHNTGIEEPSSRRKDNSDLEYMVVKPEDAMKIHWRKALLWAQESLICRDIFKNLFSDAAQATEIFSTQRENVLMVSLFSNVVLKIQLDFYPFKDGDLPQPGIPVLNTLLRHLFLSDLCIRPKLLQQFITLPLIDSQDYIAGRTFSDASKSEMKEMINFTRHTTLLSRLCKVASHYKLVQEVINELENFSIKHPDPSLSWRFYRITSIESFINVVLSNRGFVDIIPKQLFTISITHNNILINIRAKEGKDLFECGHNLEIFVKSLKMVYCRYMINSVAIQSKQWVWYVLSSNLRFSESHYTTNCDLTLYMSNVSGLYHIYFFVNYITLEKSITVERSIDLVLQRNGNSSFDKNIDDEKYVTLEYNALVGDSLLKKFDFLFAILR